MDLAAPHLGFVFVSYGLFAAVLLGLLCHGLWRGNKLRRDLQARGLNDPGESPNKKS